MHLSLHLLLVIAGILGIVSAAPVGEGSPSTSDQPSRNDAATIPGMSSLPVPSETNPENLVVTGIAHLPSQPALMLTLGGPGMTKDEVAQSLNWLSQASANAGPSLLGGQISQLTLNWLMTLLSACTTPDESDSILDGSDPFGAIIDTIDSRFDTIPETEMEYIRKAMLRILGAVANIHAKPDNMSLPFVGSTSSSTQDLEMDDDVQFVETENQT